MQAVTYFAFPLYFVGPRLSMSNFFWSHSFYAHLLAPDVLCLFLLVPDSPCPIFQPNQGRNGNVEKMSPPGETRARVTERVSQVHSSRSSLQILPFPGNNFASENLVDCNIKFGGCGGDAVDVLVFIWRTSRST